jgi:hypothetical protein
MDPHRCDAIKNWPTPKNAKQVRTILGGATYFRRFIKSFAQLTAPLRNLTKLNVPFEWTEECETSFNALKAALTSDAVLAYPRFSQLDLFPFIITLDGSKNGLGATLLQKQPDGTEKVIIYSARATRSY